MIYRHVGPRGDHVELGADERRALVELERAPWLLPIGAVLMAVTVAVSVPLAFVCSLLTAVGLAAALDRTARWARLRRARRQSPDQ